MDLAEKIFGQAVMRRDQSFGNFLKPLMREDRRERRAEDIQRGDVDLSDKVFATVCQTRGKAAKLMCADFTALEIQKTIPTRL